MAFIIGGHPRSGTTMLFRLCRNHRQIGITGEFKCFSKLDLPYPEYVRTIETDWRHFSFYWRIGRRAQWYFKLGSGIFLARYLYVLRRAQNGRVTSADVEQTLKAVLRKPLVGDKFPEYVFSLPKLVLQPNLKRVIIYRDGRDVVASFLKMLRTNWKGLPWAEKYQTAADVARQWVAAIEMMEQYRDRVFALKYESVVQNPEGEMARLAEYLQVDPAGFRTGQVHPRSVGKGQRNMPAEDLDQIEEIAGPTLRRLGYL